MPRMSQDPDAVARRLAKHRKEDPALVRARSQIGSVGLDRQRFRGLASRFERGIGNTAADRRRLRAAASSATSGNISGTRAGDTLADALRIAKARQGINLRGDKAIEGQALKDRLALARSGIGRQGRALNVQGTGQQIRKGVQLHDRAMRDATSSARAGALGGALGAFGGILKGNRESTGSLFDFGKKGPGIF